jgi:hypothetical protein
VASGMQWKFSLLMVCSLIVTPAAPTLAQNNSPAQNNNPTQNNSPAQNNGQVFRICIGEYEELCPAAKSAWFPCGVHLEEAARSVCTIHSAGAPIVKPFRLLGLYNHPGNKCGYLGVDVICLDQ